MWRNSPDYAKSGLNGNASGFPPGREREDTHGNRGELHPASKKYTRPFSGRISPRDGIGRMNQEAEAIRAAAGGSPRGLFKERGDSLSSKAKPILDDGCDLDEERREDNGDHAHELHEDVQGRTAGVLAGIADGIADDSRAMNGVLGAVRELFPAEVAFFDVLLCVVPGAAGVVQHAGE